MSDGHDRGPEPIDRAAVIARHRVRLRQVEPRWPLQLGNGSLGFAADVTGLQTYPDAYPHRYLDDVGTLLGTMTQWGWHTSPPPRSYTLAETTRAYATPRGPRPYVDLDRDTGPDGHVHGDEAQEWLRNNPHRLPLARIGFATTAPIETLTDLDQDLDLWTGVLTSRFRAPGHAGPVAVRTAVHPDRDAIGVVSEAGWPVALRFPYGSESWAIAEDWTRPDAHETRLSPLPGATGWLIDRRLDETRYTVRLRSNGTATQAGPHQVVVEPGDEPLWLVVELLPGALTEPADLLSAADVLEQSARGWAQFWGSGAAVDLGGTEDPDAHELERRMVLSQYLTRVNCAASLPPSETGLLTNSWRGKVHLEMHWWHVAHFALWGRPELVEPSLDWYGGIADGAAATARTQGYRGVRWPKQVGPEGRESPSDIGTFLLWQQPHPIHLAELVVRAHRHAGRHDRAAELQRRWAPMIAQTADLMADIAEPQPGGGYGLGPPLVPAQESYGSIRDHVTNPAFELAYWRWALLVAARWHRELDLPVPQPWREVADGMVAPHVRQGVLTAIDVDPWTIRTDHPSMLAAHGVVPPVGLVPESVARATLADVLADWDWPSTWGWDYPMVAMTAARLRDPSIAVGALLMPVAKNEHGPNGHNRQDERLPAYLPGNGGLLAAVALMVGGWEGGPAQPGTPAHWKARHEGLVPAPGPLG